jgi:hypothetical protein
MALLVFLANRYFHHTSAHAVVYINIGVQLETIHQAVNPFLSQKRTALEMEVVSLAKC